MAPAEIRELMDLKDWSKTDLASALDLTENAVYRWLAPGSVGSPRGPASILMRLWLQEARDGAAVKSA